MVHPGGRPLKFKTVGELASIADNYFSNTPEEEWTITGLALALDTTRELLVDYQNKDEFSDTIKKYKLMVHNAYEKDLRKKGRGGDIFALKNFGWTDKTETDITSGNQPISILGGMSVVHGNNGNEQDSEPPETN